MPKSHAVHKKHPFKWPIVDHAKNEANQLGVSLSKAAQAQILKDHAHMNELRAKVRKDLGLE